MLLELVFQGVNEHGVLSLSALTWMPSAFERDWAYLPIDRCARVVERVEGRIVLDLARPGRPTNP